ncbi:unnamed protein product [Auanema sp. JU1783]|nr:unnamed protein product [Auanema sp. JU1783]
MKEEDGMSALTQAVPLATSNLDAMANASLTHIPTKDVWSPNSSTSHTSSLPNGGGQMITLSPPAGDPAGSQQEPGQGSSTAAGSDLTGDAEGVWSLDIDQAFQEALAIYPPCGRRKIIISDEGKMYGRNELIARYIKLRCGKTRTRKQVSSHIQVLARKKQRDEQAKKKGSDSSPSMLNNSSPISTAASTPMPPVVSSMASAVTPSIKQEPNSISNNLQQQPPNVTPFTQIPLPSNPSLNIADPEQLQFLSKTALLPAALYSHVWAFPTFQNPSAGFSPPDMKPVINAQFSSSFNMMPASINCENKKNDTAIASSKLMLNEFTAYVERPTGQRVDIVSIPRHDGELVKLSMSSIADKYPPLLRELYEKGPKDAFFLAKCWANVQFTIGDKYSFAVDSNYKSLNRFDISVSTKVCSFGSEVVEKVEIYSAEEENDHYAFRLENSPMCEFMVKFIKELKKCENEEEMNKVLDNFTVLQVVTDKDTEDTLMVLCFVFAVNAGPESQCSLFRLTS